jgi:hypothetical protein
MVAIYKSSDPLVSQHLPQGANKRLCVDNPTREKGSIDSIRFRGPGSRRVGKTPRQVGSERPDVTLRSADELQLLGMKLERMFRRGRQHVHIP